MGVLRNVGDNFERAVNSVFEPTHKTEETHVYEDGTKVGKVTTSTTWCGDRKVEYTSYRHREYYESGGGDSSGSSHSNSSVGGIIGLLGLVGLLTIGFCAEQRGKERYEELENKELWVFPDGTEYLVPKDFPDTTINPQDPIWRKFEEDARDFHR